MKVNTLRADGFPVVEVAVEDLARNRRICKSLLKRLFVSCTLLSLLDLESERALGWEGVVSMSMKGVCRPFKLSGNALFVK